MPTKVIALVLIVTLAASDTPARADDDAVPPPMLSEWVDDAVLSAPDPALRALAERVRDGRASKPELRAFHEAFILQYPFDRPVDPSWRELAFRHIQRGEAKRGAARIVGSNWVNLGPTDEGGRTSAIAVHPTNPNLAYIGAAAGGVWKWEWDGAASVWTPLFEDQPSLAIGSIGLDPTDPDRIYVGTGEMNYAIDNYSGVGLIRSTDGGTSWLPPVSIGGAARLGRIEVRPDQPSTIFAATTNGLYRSDDFGDNWTEVLDVGDATDVRINPNDPDIVYAGGRGDPSGVWRSTTGGDAGSFVQITDTGSTNDRVALAIAASQPMTVYAAYNFNGGEVWKTTDGGDNWTHLSEIDGFCGGQCWYDMVLGVDPTDPDNVIAGGVRIYRSTDGGANWSGSIGGIHVDHHAIEFLGSTKQLLNGNDGGVYRLDVSGGTTGVENLEDGYITIQYYGMGYDPVDATIVYGGTQDNGTHRFNQPNTDASNVGLVSCGDGAALRVHPTLNNRIFHTNCPIGGMSILVSDNFGSSSSRQTNGIDRAEGSNWVPPVEMTADGTVYTGSSNRVYKCTNADTGDINDIVWTGMGADDITPSGSITTVSQSPVNPDIVWAGASSGYVSVTTDGTNWTEKWRDNGGSSRYIGKVQASPTDADIAWITLGGLGGSAFGGGHVWETNDLGDTWIDISGDLPDAPVQSFVIDDDDPDHFWVGTWFGVFKTEDHGATWVFQSGMPKVPVAELVLNPASKTLYAATHGRGIWRLEDESGGVPPKPVPDGVIDLGTPMYATKAPGDQILVTWDPSCTGDTDYNLFFGSLADQATYAYSGAECGLGVAGAATFDSPPGDVFWLMAGQNAAGDESGHRRDGAGPGWVPAASGGLCGAVTGQDLTQSCP